MLRRYYVDIQKIVELQNVSKIISTLYFIQKDIVSFYVMFFLIKKMYRVPFLVRSTEEQCKINCKIVGLIIKLINYEYRCEYEM